MKSEKQKASKKASPVAAASPAATPTPAATPSAADIAALASDPVAFEKSLSESGLSIADLDAIMATPSASPGSADPAVEAQAEKTESASPVTQAQFRPYASHPEIPGRYAGNGNMSVEELVKYLTDEHVMRYTGWSEEEIQEAQKKDQERNASNALEASALYSGDATKGKRRRALDCFVQDFLRAHHAGFRLPRPRWVHKSEVGEPYRLAMKMWDHPESHLVRAIEEAILRGDEGFFRTLGAVVREVKARSAGEETSFVIAPAKPQNLVIQKAKGTPKSGQDIADLVHKETGIPISPRHGRRLLQSLGKKPKNRGGRHTHK